MQSNNDLAPEEVIDIPFDWKRPEDIARIVSGPNATPKFVADGISRFDAMQGKLGTWPQSLVP